ncbi:MAG: MFS transporter [Mariprofundaceae bacterium]|nr:MFS transporter [Mariprofundaceae bacterium]
MVTASSLHHIRLFYAAYFAAMGLILPFFPVYLASLGYSVVVIGMMTGLLAAAKVIAPPCSGYWLDTRGMAAGRFIVLASCLAALCVALFNVTSSYTPAFISIVLLFGMLWAAVLPLTDGLSIHVSEAALADYGRLRVWGSIGFVVTSLLGGIVFGEVSLAWFPWFLVVLMLVMAFAGRGFPSIEHVEMPEMVYSGFSRALLLLFVVSFLMQLSHGAYYGFFSLYLLDIGYSGWQVGMFWVVGVLAEIVLMWRWAKPIQSMPLMPVILVCLLLTGLRWLGTGWSHAWWLLVLLQCLHAASFAAFHVVAITWVKRLAPPHRHAAAQGWFSATGFGLGTTVGIMACGLIVATYGFSAAFYTCAGIAFLAMLVARRLPR